MSFTTPAAPPVCTDVHEVLNNNTMTAASAIVANVMTTATIGTSTDADWFSFTNSATQPHIQVALSNMKVNYGINLYNQAGILISLSNNLGTTNELIRYNNAPVGKYYIQVFNNSGSNDAYTCYNLIANTSAVPYAIGTREGGDASENPEDNNTITEEITSKILTWEMGTQPVKNENANKTAESLTELTFKVFPNPVTNNAIINVNASEEDMKVDVYIFDAMGRVVYEQEHTVNAESNKIIVNLGDQMNGLYLVRLKSRELQNVQKIIVRH
jgi:hypothetical protein